MLDTINAANRFAARVKQIEAGGVPTRAAIGRAQNEDDAGATAYRLSGLCAGTPPGRTPVISLTASPGESFDELATRHAIEQKVSLRNAIHAVGLTRPDLAQAR